MEKDAETLEQYAFRFGVAVEAWSIEQWRTVATELASRLDAVAIPNAPQRGRPRTANSFSSARTNYQALAWQVKERIDAAAVMGNSLEIRATVEQIMRESAAKSSLRSGRVAAKLETAYTEVRKLLKEWSKAEKK
jgi:hypothetical protein